MSRINSTCSLNLSMPFCHLSREGNETCTQEMHYCTSQWLYSTGREREWRSFLQPTHGYGGGTKGLLKYLFTHSYTHSRGFYKAICYCNCVNEAGDILHPSCSVLGLKGSSFVLLSPLFVFTLILIHTHTNTQQPPL